MKKLFLMALAACCISVRAEVEMPDFPKIRYTPDILYISEGFRLGYIINVKWEGIVIWTFEGQMTLGVGTGPDQMVDRLCVEQHKADKDVADINKECAIFINPWKFSFLDSRMYRQYKQLGFVPVVIYYAVPTITPWKLLTVTKNYLHEIYPVDPSFPVPEHYEINKSALPLARHLNPEAGFVPGRIVKASLDHALFKTYEVIIQEGVNGNNFSRMSVNDSEMFDHIVRAMMTGKLLRIGFVRLFEPEGAVASLRGYDTNYRITSIDLIADEVMGNPQQAH